MANRFKSRLEHIRNTSPSKLIQTDTPQPFEQPVFDAANQKSAGTFKKRLEHIRMRNANKKPDAAATNDTIHSTGRAQNRKESSEWEKLNAFCEVHTTHVPLPCAFTSHLSTDWPSLIPQTAPLFETEYPVSATSLLFFDLETTGLSGGAGTVAFLAAFGSLSTDKQSQETLFTIRQYLLLDYQGEREYLCAIQKELANTSAHLVSYNGRAFDEQILRTRFLLNGITFPEHAYHFDLLYPARTLWKNHLESCSQKTLETAILGNDRGYDLGGEFAPYAWFEYLRTGNKSKVLEIAEHNRKDIEGLAGIFFVINTILENPSDTRWTYDTTRLGVRLTHQTKKLSLLKVSAENNAEAMLAYGSACIKQGLIPEGISILTKLAHKTDAPSLLRADALRKLAIHAEWYKKNYNEALLYTDQALQLSYLTLNVKYEFEKRKVRLKRKIS